jgi:hypothetical protein
LFDCVVCAEGVNEVVSVLFSFIFDSKIINCEGELNGFCDVFPEDGHVRDLKVSKGSKPFLEELVC